MPHRPARLAGCVGRQAADDDLWGGIGVTGVYLAGVERASGTSGGGAESDKRGEYLVYHRSSQRGLVEKV